MCIRDRYNVNDKVTVTAKTDTGYFKLSDGSFIHGDYLSDSKVTHDDFRDVTNFNTQETLNALGFATSDIAEMGDRKSTRLNSSHSDRSRMPSSA